MAYDVSRRAVLQSAPLLLATLVRCANTLTPGARMAEAFVVDPSWESYQPILRGVITAILPFEAPGFPAIAPQTVERHLVSLFPLEKEAQFLGLQRTLVLLDELDLFPLFGGPLAQEESKARDLVARGEDVEAVLRAIREDDLMAFQAFRHPERSRGTQAGGRRDERATTPQGSSTTLGMTAGAGRFRDLSLEQRRAALGLWRDSASIVKRQFYGALRGIVMVTMWSMDEAWPSIGYAGPLLPRTVSAS